MNTVALRRQLPLIRLSATALGILLLAGTVFLILRYWRLSGQGESFYTAFETGRMLVNFGGLALLSPIAYAASRLALKHPKFQIPLWLIGLLCFAIAYLAINKVVLWLIADGQVTMDFWKGGKKLFLNFGHILVLSYTALLYGSMVFFKREINNEKRPPGREDQDGIKVKIDGLGQRLPLSSISHLLANDHYLRVYAEGKFYMVRNSISGISAHLNADFQQIHRSTLVNILHVQKVYKKEGRIWVKMKDGSEHRVSARYEKSALLLAPVP